MPTHQHNDRPDSFAIFSKGVLLLALLWMSWSLILSPIDYWQGNAAARSFLHNINLPFHEFGHILFRPLGQFMHSLGGSLGQLLMPIICLYVLLWQTRDVFGAAVCLWWLGESFLDLVAYINDAKALTMPLMGGNEGRSSPYGFHDWEYILTESGSIHHAANFARATHFLGSMLMIGALIWLIFLWLKMRRHTS